MKHTKSLLSMTLVAALALASCSGLPKGAGGGGGGGGGNGNTFLNVTVTSTPSSTFSFAALNWQIGGLSMTSSAGTSEPIGATPSPTFDFVRLQTDSANLGHSSIPATSYTSLQVQFNAPLSSYFYNSSNATLLGCLAGTVCLIPNTVTGFGASTVTVPITFTGTANANTGIRINFDLSKAVTTTGGMTFDFTQAGAITVTTLPPTSSQTSGIDTIDNFTGVVTATSGSTVTVSSFSSQARTFTVSSSAEFDDPFSVCSGQAGLNCLAPNQNISIDGVLNADGTMTANEVDFLDKAPAVNELEGVIITPLSNNQFKMALANGMGTTGLNIGTTVIVNLNGAESYVVDPKDLQISNPVTGFLSQSDLVMGQTVMIQAGTFNGTNTSITNPTRVLLRYSSIGGTVETPGNPDFGLGEVSPFLVNLIGNSVQVATFSTTAYDNISSNNLSTGTIASIRGLYLDPNSGAAQPLLAAKVRTH
jgi:Domain of unknown function (DUF5666)